MVSLDLECPDLEKRIELWEKLLSLKSILINDYLPNAIFEDFHLLENQKEISRVYVEKHGVSIHNKATWQETMMFLNQNMLQFEAFFMGYREVIIS